MSGLENQSGNERSTLAKYCEQLEEKLMVQQETIAKMQPKAAYYDFILQCKDLIATTIIAKDYGMSAVIFNKLLNELGVQYKQGDTWVLYAKYHAGGYMRSKTHNFADTDGVQHAAEHTYWTPKGRMFLYELLKEQGIYPVDEIKM